MSASTCRSFPLGGKDRRLDASGEEPHDHRDRPQARHAGPCARPTRPSSSPAPAPASAPRPPARSAADGWNVAVGFAQNASGAAEIVARIEEAGGRAVAVGGDIGEPGAAERLVAQAAELGPLLGLVNNAGVRADGLALQLTDEEWDAVIATNLTAAFRLTRAVLKRAVRARYGRIVNVA